jgi:hypothetical protein
MVARRGDTLDIDAMARSRTSVGGYPKCEDGGGMETWRRLS